jgi:thiol-disulfide isomerase/thioredoxin
MANRQRAEARRKAQAKAARQSGEGGSFKWLWIGLGVVVLVVAGIVVFASSGDDSKASQSTDNTSLSNLPDSQPVTVTGDPLDKYLDGTAPADDSAFGVSAPVLSGLDFQGDPVVIDPAKEGQAYMVVFLAHWCPHCNAEIPRLLDWKKTGGVPDNLKIVGVATAVSPTAAYYPPAQWFSVKGWSWPVMVDQSQGAQVAGVAATAYGASGWPYFVIVGADGKVKARYSGEIEIDALQQLVDDAMAA